MTIYADTRQLNAKTIPTRNRKMQEKYRNQYTDKTTSGEWRICDYQRDAETDAVTLYAAPNRCEAMAARQRLEPLEPMPDCVPWSCLPFLWLFGGDCVPAPRQPIHTSLAFECFDSKERSSLTAPLPRLPLLFEPMALSRSFHSKHFYDEPF